jgi:hypothetical protein
MINLFSTIVPKYTMKAKEYDSGYSRGTCTAMFIAALFTIAKLWKQSRCPTTDKWVKKMWYFHSWGCTQKTVTQVTPEGTSHPCLLQHYSQ